ncbi:hypothetical protein CVIRNUC_002467 [Coccomyxa viridis]|uniref:Phosphoglycerate mutase n=1 Tax=Coccomyxa viridis TaxID=1274662 RepID=A0AAV1HYW5_9CHLO|nr:hypothetical protein CVIRNUC_002467 [Coccomyxa viridis]
MHQSVRGFRPCVQPKGTCIGMKLSRRGPMKTRPQAARGRAANRDRIGSEAASGSNSCSNGHVPHGKGKLAGTGFTIAAALGQNEPAGAKHIAGSPSRHALTKGHEPLPEMPEKEKVDVILTKEDGTQIVYHTNRRDALHHMFLSVGVLSSDSFRWMWAPRRAEAALLQFPTASLRNKYFLVRAGEGESEAEGYVLTNPVAKTSMSSGLSSKGKAQVLTETAPALKALGACNSDCWLWPSITQRSYQTAEILGSLMRLSYQRIVPEYSFLDPRGLGSLEGGTWESAQTQVNTGDLLSPEWRPPRGSDGTPNESISDVLVRVRQVMSITETQYNGASVVIISPDSDNLSVLQAALLGLDLRRHSQLAMRPGEVRAVELASASPALYSGKVTCARPPNCL